MKFTVIDVETANADMGSICQIGLAQYKDGLVSKEWSSLINPKDHFDRINTSIHGITEENVNNAPTFDGVFDVISDYMNSNICVCHTHFDRVSISKALKKNGLVLENVKWLDSAKVTRRTWPELAYRGYGLANVCKVIGYEFQHHDALEDAKASGQIILEAIKKTDYTIDEWLSKVQVPMSSSKEIRKEGNPEGELYGESVVFTGALEIPRKEASILASSVGCNVESGVTKNTTLLVVGDQDISKLAGKEKSRKHINAEMKILKGQNIRILMESDFKVMVHYDLNPSEN